MSQEPKIYLPLLDNGSGSVMAGFFLDFHEAFAGRNIQIAHASDSHADRGMNKIANGFLASDCDLWINIDADIRFRRQDIDALLSHLEPLVYGVYPKKQDDTPPCLGTFETIETDAAGMTVVRRAGRGFMLVRRALLEAMKEDNGGPALRYHNHGAVEWDFFPSGVVTGEASIYADDERDAAGYPKREWISEDWYFCERARALGVKALVDSNIVLGHVGSKHYRFSPGQTEYTAANVKSWRDIHGWFDYEDLYRKIVAVLPNNSRFVEVGCWMGRSIAAFHEFAKEAGKTIELHVVDTFEGAPSNGLQQAILKEHGGNIERVFRTNMKACGINGELTIHRKASVNASHDFYDKADAIFIDADHSESAVRNDIAAWLPHLRSGGILCGHDYDEPGVKSAVDYMLVHIGGSVETVGRCWVYQK